MHKIATLGPSGTYSEQACIRFIQQLDDACKIHFFASIKKVIAAVGDESDIGVIPIENFSEGYVSTVLDELSKTDVQVLAEVMLPIRFSYVSNQANKQDVETLFVQFVAKNQCSEFLESFQGVDFVQTESNILSLEQLKRCETPAAAIIPSAAVNQDEFARVEHDVADYEENQTRFLVLGKPALSINLPIDLTTSVKTSIIVFNDNDCPGALNEILNGFASRGINLLSIISRPTRQAFGQYFFYIDLEGHAQSPNVASALRVIQSQHRIKILGSYHKIHSE
ncbi:prephenate dehydratase [Shewanella sp. 202IG2-18]|uniref:prephenate dehydratase n=1 Tax=Parashewanella hymeniacidonis TaxID=2807618 RepID=UPI00195F8A7A|nr:prephenate dehydratase [Parashewanella hymeniacidonis]MBM7074634.1 prephenate dehydratase [Parashewanella hymeniacidonis]